MRGGANGNVGGRNESSVTISQTDHDIVRNFVCHGKVKFAVAIEVSDDYLEWTVVVKPAKHNFGRGR